MSSPRLGYGRVSSHPHEPDPLGFVRSYRTGFVLGIRPPWWFGQYAPTTAPDTGQALRGNNTYATGSQHEKNPQALHLDQNHHPDPRNPGTTMTTNLRRRTLARNRTSQNGRYDSFCSNGTNVFR